MSSSTFSSPSPPSASSSHSSPCACSFLHPGRSCISFIASSFGRSFYLAYGLRAGLSLALHIIKLVRTRPSSLTSLEEIFGARGLPLEAVRLGLFFGGFTGIYNALNCLLTRLRGKFDSSTALTSGACAGLSLLFLDRSSHRTLALYLFARVIQAVYNKQKQVGKFHFWGSSWQHGDTLLFALSCAQILYSYVMRPETLPPAYLKFMLETAPLHSVTLEAIRNTNRGIPLDIDKLTAYNDRFLSLYPGIPSTPEILRSLVGPSGDPKFPSLLPCYIAHPETPFCTSNFQRTVIRAFKRVFPLYLSLTFVPMFVLRFWSLLKHPGGMIYKGLSSALRSSAFVVMFVTSYMEMTCVHRKVLAALGMKDIRFLYWLYGMISGSAVLLEVKSRRSELALYCLPRALDSFYLGLVDRKLLFTVPRGELLLFCFSMSVLMFYREFHSQNLSPLLLKILHFFVPSHKTIPAEPSEEKHQTEPIKQIKEDEGVLNHVQQDETLVALGKGVLSPVDSTPLLQFSPSSTPEPGAEAVKSLEPLISSSPLLPPLSPAEAQAISLQESTTNDPEALIAQSIAESVIREQSQTLETTKQEENKEEFAIKLEPIQPAFVGGPTPVEALRPKATKNSNNRKKLNRK
jgi:hypothetical protein